VGRPRKPNHLKILSGEREDRINRNEPIPGECDITPPGLSTVARQVWDRLAPDLIDKGCLTAWDVDLFSVYCEAVATYYDARQKMGTDYIVQGSTKNKVPSPYHRSCKTASPPWSGSAGGSV
jgi:phage terminase small subunit